MRQLSKKILLIRVMQCESISNYFLCYKIKCLKSTGQYLVSSTSMQNLVEHRKEYECLIKNWTRKE